MCPTPCYFYLMPFLKRNFFRLLLAFFVRYFIRNIRERKNSTHVQPCIPFWLIAPHLNFNYTTYVLCRSRLLVRTSQAYLRFGTYIVPNQILKCLRDCFLFKFILLNYIYVGYTNIHFYERLIFNTFCINLYILL